MTPAKFVTAALGSGACLIGGVIAKSVTASQAASCQLSQDLGTRPTLGCGTTQIVHTVGSAFVFAGGAGLAILVLAAIVLFGLNQSGAGPARAPAPAARPPAPPPPAALEVPAPPARATPAGTQISLDDVLWLIDAIRRDTIGEPGANLDVDRAIEQVSASDDSGTVLEALAFFGQILQEQVPRERREEAVVGALAKLPEQKSPAARQAFNELGRALFLDGTPDQLAEIVRRQIGNPDLSEQEQSVNLFNLTIAAGRIAASIDLVLKFN